jgi:hypothetical protein
MKFHPRFRVQMGNNHLNGSHTMSPVIPVEKMRTGIIHLIIMSRDEEEKVGRIGFFKNILNIVMNMIEAIRIKADTICTMNRYNVGMKPSVWYTGDKTFPPDIIIPEIMIKAMLMNLTI